MNVLSFRVERHSPVESPVTLSLSSGDVLVVDMVSLQRDGRKLDAMVDRGAASQAIADWCDRHRVPYALLAREGTSWRVVARYGAIVEPVPESALSVVFFGDPALVPEWFHALRARFDGVQVRRILHAAAEAPTGESPDAETEPHAQRRAARLRRLAIATAAGLVMALLVLWVQGRRLSSRLEVLEKQAAPKTATVLSVPPAPPTTPNAVPLPTPRVPDVALEFPLDPDANTPDGDPYRARLAAVFDHDMRDNNGNFALRQCDGTVQAFTGERQTGEPDEYRCRDGVAYPQQGQGGFHLNGGFAPATGGSAVLGFDGNPGIDLVAREATEVRAVADGTIRYPDRIVGLPGGPRMGRILELTPDGGDLRIYYLNLSSVRVLPPRPDKVDVGCPDTLPPLAGTHVDAGCVIGLTGAPGAMPPLHLEVHRIVQVERVARSAVNVLKCPDDPTRACVPVDPYGWDGEGKDPYEQLTNIPSRLLWRHTPVVTAVRLEQDDATDRGLTVTGRGFDPHTSVYVRRQSAGPTTTLRILHRLDDAIVAEAPRAAGTYFVSVESDGRRSNARRVRVDGPP